MTQTERSERQEHVQSVALTITLVMDVARVGLLVAATKKLEVCKLFVYLQIVWYVAEQPLI